MVLGDGTAEIAHDALLQAWPRLRGWLEEDQSSLILYGQLAEDTARWRQDGKDSSRLYRGVQLAAAREAARVWAADPGRYPALPAAEAEFLRASGRAGTRRRWGRRTLAGALVLVLLAALAEAGLAVRSARDDAQPAAYRGDVGAARRAEHDAGRHRPGHRVAARRGRVADRADRAGTLQPARVAGPAGARHPGRPFG